MIAIRAGRYGIRPEPLRARDRTNLGCAGGRNWRRGRFGAGLLLHVEEGTWVGWEFYDARQSSRSLRRITGIMNVIMD